MLLHFDDEQGLARRIAKAAGVAAGAIAGYVWERMDARRGVR